MGRILKRVPMDFDWPIGKVWDGYIPTGAKDKIKAWDGWGIEDSVCSVCSKRGNDCDEGATYCIYYPDNKAIWYYDPPTGDGYQLWETTSEGSPMSPVFKTLEELCEYLEREKVSWFGSFTATKEQWMDGLRDDGAGLLFAYRRGE